MRTPCILVVAVAASLYPFVKTIRLHTWRERICVYTADLGDTAGWVADQHKANLTIKGVVGFCRFPSAFQVMFTLPCRVLSVQ